MPVHAICEDHDLLQVSLSLSLSLFLVLTLSLSLSLSLWFCLCLPPSLCFYPPRSSLSPAFSL